MSKGRKRTLDEIFNINNTKKLKRLSLEEPNYDSFIIKSKAPLSDNEYYYIGVLNIAVTENQINDPSTSCKLIMPDDTTDIATLTVEKKFITDVLRCKYIYYTFEKDSVIKMNVYIQYLSEDLLSPRYANTLRRLISLIFNKKIGPDKLQSKIKTKYDLEELYVSVRKKCMEKEDFKTIKYEQHLNLLPKLRPYQVQAVQWMLFHETDKKNSEEHPNPLYEPLMLPNSKTLYYNEYTGHMTEVLPKVSGFAKGGILADEMGLGKTVEVLACILSNQRELTNNVLEITTDFSIDGRKIVEDDSFFYYLQRLKETEYDSDSTDDMIVSYQRIIRQNLQCICGKLKMRKHVLRCLFCGIFQHRRCINYKGNVTEFFCSKCWLKMPPFPVKATLIISPTSISGQWLSEIKKHTANDSLNILVYNGVHKSGYIYPTDLAKYDVVLTTYSVLQSELKFVGDNELNVRLRHNKKYYSPHSPLVMVEWWRVCLDEAQVVDSATTIVAEMACRLTAVNRWAVSGTPAQRGLQDLYGLVLFLGIMPYCDKSVWDRLLYIPYCNGDKEPLQTFLSDILWRSAKNDVSDQINIPEQTKKVYWLKFSPVEDFFYKREHELCASSFQKKLTHYESLDITLDSIDRNTMGKLLQPLLTLRQACIHPHVVRGRYLTSKKNVMSMDDLLDALISKNINECEDSVRAYIAALNGLAGIHMIRNEWVEAAESYREVLRFVQQHEGRLKTDTLQQLHTLYNLSELLEGNYPDANIPPTLRDHQLQELAANLEKQYILKSKSLVQTAEEEFNKCTDVAKKTDNKFVLEVGAWLAETVMFCNDKDLINELMERIQTALTDHSTNKHDSIAESLTTPSTVIYQITVWFDKIIDDIENLRKEFENLKTFSTAENDRFTQTQVQNVVFCHLRPIDENQKKLACFMCEIEKKMTLYECKIFSISTKMSKNNRRFDEENDDHQKVKGDWKPSQQEIVMKVILSYGRIKGVDSELIKDGDTHLELCEALKKEFREMRRLWTYYSEQICAQDELNMCKERLRLRMPNEKPDKPKKGVILKNLDYNIENKLDDINVIDPHMLDVQWNILYNDKTGEISTLQKKIGTLNYLETLKKKSYSSENPDPCPVCRNQMEDHWSVLQCGHSFCLECIHQILVQNVQVKSVMCCVCRQTQSYQDISYIHVKNNETVNDSDTKMKGSFSTKVEAIVKFVLELRNADPDVKILLFSSWERVLYIMEEAFRLNEIKYEHLNNTKFHMKLEKFKDSEGKITVLLLPIHAGSRGLNLIEATHVIFTEPLLNPGDELQAIGRVHRIGQTKPTQIHHFLVENTIEESIFKSVTSNTSEWDNDQVTLQRLSDLFKIAT